MLLDTQALFNLMLTHGASHAHSGELREYIGGPFSSSAWVIPMLMTSSTTSSCRVFSLVCFIIVYHRWGPPTFSINHRSSQHAIRPSIGGGESRWLNHQVRPRLGPGNSRFHPSRYQSFRQTGPRSFRSVNQTSRARLGACNAQARWIQTELDAWCNVTIGV